jgi:Mg-chelatase subunit ChlD
MHRTSRTALRLAVLLLLLPTMAAPAPASGPWVPAPTATAPGADDEIVKEFKKYFRKYKDTPTRVEAILALEGTESQGVVKVLLPILKDKELDVVRAAIRVLGGFKTRPPVDLLLLTLAENKDEAVRVGIIQSLGMGGYADTKEGLLPCLEDKSWDVRRRAIQALAVTRDETVAPAIAPLCADRETAVRCAALEGLADLKSQLVVDPAIGDLTHETWQVRASAIRALGIVRHVKSVGPLIERMALEEGRLVEDIGHALANLTGRDFGQRIEGWQGFWNRYKDTYKIPTDAEIRRLREKQKERKAEYEPRPGVVSYHGIETPSRSILFVIDVSGSMESLAIETERFKDGNYPSFKRIDIVKTELKRTVQDLESYVKFNIVSFATDIKRWKKTLVTANVLNKSSASTWIRRLESIGGSSKEDLASVGLTGSANLEAGRTNTYGALMDALGAAGRGRKDKNYEVSVDTIFFLSDGRPSHGKYVDTDDILREVREANELRKVVIHTIALGEFEKDFMRNLAEQNGGIFVDLGR